MKKVCNSCLQDIETEPYRSSSNCTKEFIKKDVSKLSKMFSYIGKFLSWAYHHLYDIYLLVLFGFSLFLYARAIYYYAITPDKIDFCYYTDGKLHGSVQWHIDRVLGTPNGLIAAKELSKELNCPFEF